jgi:hypothetical protein
LDHFGEVLMEPFIGIPFRSRKTFFYFVNFCNDNYRFDHDLQYYREIIDMHRTTEKLETILDNDEFYRLLHDTLEKWNMNQRGARLKHLDTIKKSILTAKPLLKELYQHKINTIESFENESGQKIIRFLGYVFKGLEIMESKRRIVGVSKAMHFLLPDLLLPIDSKYTMTCLFGYNKFADNAGKEFETFKDIVVFSQHVVRTLKLTDGDVDGIQWNTSIPKLIDNAMIGFDKFIEINGDRAISLLKEIES